MLSPTHLQDYHEQGYLVLEDFCAPAWQKRLKAAADKWVHELKEEWEQAIFSTTQQTHHSKSYFLESGDKVRISESGIQSAEDAAMLRRHGYQGFLIGEMFMRTADPAQTAAKFMRDLNELNENAEEKV